MPTLRKKEILRVRNITFSPTPQEEFDRAIFRIFDILLNQKGEEKNIKETKK